MTDPKHHQSLVRALGVAAIVTMATAMTTGARAADDTAVEKLAAQDECPKCDLSKADLSGGGCPGSDFSEANLSGANLEGVVMNEATLQGANLSNANLTDAIFESANLKGVNLTGADLTRTDLSGADLSGATGLTQAQLEETCDDGSADPEAAILPDGLVLKRCE